MEKEILLKFGNALKKARLAKGLSQEKLAEATNFDRTYISFLERGKRNPSLLCLASLCQVLEIKLSELFQEIES